MRTREKQRIYKRFMDDHSIGGIVMDLLVKGKKKTITIADIDLMRDEVEQALRDVISAKLEFYESWTGEAKRKGGGE
jgi:hypothetical protein